MIGPFALSDGSAHGWAKGSWFVRGAVVTKELDVRVQTIALVLFAACTQPAEPGSHFPSSVQVDGDLLVNSGRVRLIQDSSSPAAPEIRWFGAHGEWTTGIDTSNPGGPRDLVLAGKAHWPSGNLVDDLIYVAHNGDGAPTVGVGVTPPDRTHRLQISGQDSEPQMGTLQLRATSQQTGNVLTAIDSGGAPRWWLDAGFWLTGSHPATQAAVAIKAQATSERPLVLARSTGDGVFGFQYATDGSGTLALRYFTGGVDIVQLRTDGRASFPNGITTPALRVEPRAAPATATSPCTQGDIAYDPNYVYVCVAQNTWKRSALASW
jgi:hypothetical protein